MEGTMFFFACVVGFVFILLLKGVYVIKQSEAMIVERLGKFHQLCPSGLHFIVPLLDNVRQIRLEGRYMNRIDLREMVIDFAPQPVITKDNVTMLVDSVIYFQVADPVRAVYEVADISMAIRQLAMTSLRNLMGELNLDETLTSRELVNGKLRSTLDEASDKWGVKVTRVELKNITPPQEIEDAMAKQMKAERERRAVVTEAEGRKTAQVLNAEGARDSNVATAEGEKQARILRAEAEAISIMKVAQAQAGAIKIVFQGIHEGRPTKELISFKYLETLEKIANGKGNKVFIPYEATAVLGALAGVKEMLGKSTDEAAENE